MALVEIICPGRQEHNYLTTPNTMAADTLEMYEATASAAVFMS